MNRICMKTGRAFLLVLSFVWPAGAESLALPERPPDAPGATALIEKLASMSAGEREQTILAELKRGNVPSFLRQFVQVPVEAEVNGSHLRGNVSVLPDYLAIGSD